MKILILNGPNLNLTGIREPEIYGSITFENYLKELKLKFVDIQIDYFQSNIEGEIIDKLHEVGFSYNAIVFNPGAYSHYSYAIADAIKSIKTIVIEVHISNLFNREDYRQKSVTAANAIGVISGFGLSSYNLAIEHIISIKI